jgi:hypothetical protein
MNVANVATKRLFFDAFGLGGSLRSLVVMIDFADT